MKETMNERVVEGSALACGLALLLTGLNFFEDPKANPFPLLLVCLGTALLIGTGAFMIAREFNDQG